MPALRNTLPLIGLLVACIAAALFVFGLTSSEGEGGAVSTSQHSHPAARSLAQKELPAVESAPDLTAGISSSAASHPAQTKHDEISAVWEDRLFDVLELGLEEMSERNARLIELATVAAVGEPRVQQECLRHLAFGLPSSSIAQMVSIATDARIPEEARAEFVSILLETRPDDVAAALRAAVPAHYEGRWKSDPALPAQ